MANLPPSIRRATLLLAAVLLSGGVVAFAQSGATATRTAPRFIPRAAYAPPGSVAAEDDAEENAGTALVVKWKAAQPGALPKHVALVAYEVLVAQPPKAPLLVRAGRRLHIIPGPSPETWEAYKPKAQTSPEETTTSLDGLNALVPYKLKVAALYADPDHPWYSPASEEPVEARALFCREATFKTDPQGSLELAWNGPKSTKGEEQTELIGYLAEATPVGGGPPVRMKVGADETGASFADLAPSRPYVLKVATLYAPPQKEWYAPGDEVPVKATAAESAEFGPVSPVGLWFDPAKTNVLVGMVLYTIIVVLCFAYARRGDMYIRPIAGLKAVDDAIGRATEMGRPILYVQGLSGIGEISTIASMLVLGHLARKTAPYETPVMVPCFDPLVMAADREIVREAYLEAGRPQAYRPESIFFVTDSQFGYVAGVDGMMLREKPAANFFMGYFYAESLILAETGNASGAIQIAGTDADTQIPFFITACDYTLMGEELYAASAYLSRDPKLLAQLKGQDIGKAVMTVLLVVASILVTLKAFGPQFSALAEWVAKLFGT